MVFQQQPAYRQPIFVVQQRPAYEQPTNVIEQDDEEPQEPAYRQVQEKEVG